MTNTTAKTLLFSALPLLLLPANTLAQIAADGTTSTTVTPTATGVQIDSGDRSGGNLFHSFQDFSIPTGTEAHFNNANDIANIFSRVTGGNISDIDGLIRANGTANLFLINPNGIIFGENASLQLGGSFFATTADGILFDDDVAFSASDPTTPLLTSSIPIGANFRDNPGDINITGNTLTVEPDKTLAFIGGNLNSNSADLEAPGGHIELGGLLQAGTVGIEEIEGQFRFSFPSEEIARTNVLLTNSNFVDVRSDGGGSITINAENIDIRNGSELNGGFANGQGSPEAQAGDIILNATGNITLATTEDIDNSFGGAIFNNVEFGSQGNAGNITITGNSLLLDNGSQVQSLVRQGDENNPTAGRGNAGNITIDVDGEVKITGEDGDNNFASLISSEVGEGNFNSDIAENEPREGDFRAGNITINAGSLMLERKEGQNNPNSIISSSEGLGFAGDIIINAGEDVTIFDSNIETNGNFGRIFIGSVPEDRSDEGITVEVPSKVSIQGTRNEGADVNDPRTEDTFTTNISTTNFGRPNGEAGRIEIQARDEINISGSRFDSNTQITNLSRPNSSENNNFGTTIIKVLGDNPEDKIFINEAEILNTNSDIGFAGDIIINAPGSIEIIDSQLLADGRNGRILIGDDATFSPQNVTITELSSLSTTNNYVTDPSLSETAINAGGISITANQDISISNGSTIRAFTNRLGDAGDVTLNAGNNINIRDGLVITIDVPKNSSEEVLNIEQIENFTSSGVFSNVLAGGDGEAGDITINANSLTLLNGAAIQTQINPPETFDNFILDGEVISDELSQDLNQRFYNNPDGLPAGKGTAGNITLNVDGAVNLSNSDNPALDENNFLTPEVNGNQNLISNFISSSVGFGAEGNGGNVSINADSLSVRDFSTISSATSGKGNAGSIDIDVNDFIQLKNSASLRTTIEPGGESEAGNINIEANSLTVDTGSQIGSAVLRPLFRLEELGGEIPAGIGKAGDITINVNEDISISGIAEAIEEPNLINSFTGTSFITGVESSGIFSSAERDSTRLNSEEQAAGDIMITSGGKISIKDGALINAFTSNDGDAGDITITANDLELTDGGQILATTRGGGNAGNINLDIQNNLTVSGSDSNFQERRNSVEAQINQAEQSRPENERSPVDDIINNRTSRNNEENRSAIIAETDTQGNGGTVSIGIFQEDSNGQIILNPNQFTKDITVEDSGFISASTSGLGNAGSLKINTEILTLDREGQIFSLTNTNGSLSDNQAKGGDIIINAPGSITLNREVSEPKLAAISAQTQGNGQGGNVSLNTRQLTMRGNALIDAQFVEDVDNPDNNKGNAGSVTIDLINTFSSDNDNDGKLTMIGDESNQPKIEVGAEAGIAGNIFITANDIEQNRGEISAQSTSGTSGNIEILTNFLTLDNDSSISSQTQIGEAGNITIENENDTPLNRLELNNSSSITVDSNEGVPSNLNEEESEANLTIFAETIEQNNGTISAQSTFGTSGSVEIFTNSLTLNDDSSISSQTGSGTAGGITIQRDESGNFLDTLNLNSSDITVEVSGESEGTAGNISIFANSITQNSGTISAQSTFGTSGSVEIFTNSLTLNDDSSISSQTQTGEAGNITIENENDTPLNILELNNSDITVLATGGEAGDITITTNSLEQNGGNIIAETGITGANINLNIANLWTLSNDSDVTANLTNDTQATQTGGIININTSNNLSDTKITNPELLILAFPPTENSGGNDITASAESNTAAAANGGQINIGDVAGIFGIKEREGNTPLNDFDVSAENGVAGTITTENNLEDPSSGLVELPATVGDASDTIAQNPCEQGVGSEFLVMGKGGFPANPQNNFSSNEMRVGLVESVTPESQTATVDTVEKNNNTSTEEPTIVPAQGWILNDEGKLVLTAYDPTNQGVQRTQKSFTGCSVSHNQPQQHD